VFGGCAHAQHVTRGAHSYVMARRRRRASARPAVSAAPSAPHARGIFISHTSLRNALGCAAQQRARGEIEGPAGDGCWCTGLLA
jgi:hypothetical protein